MDNPYNPPESEHVAPEKSSLGKWILWGCGGVFVLILLLGLSCYVFIKGAIKVGSSEFGPACAEYLVKVEAKDFSGAYQLLGEAGKAQISENKHNALVGGIFQKLGAVKSTEVQFVASGIDQTGSWGKITYRTQFQKGPGTIRFELRKYSGQYKIIGVFIDSPVLADAINKALANQASQDEK